MKGLLISMTLIAGSVLAQTGAPIRKATTVERVRIPTYLAQSMTRKVVMPRDIGVPGKVVLEALVGRDGRVLKARGISGDARLIEIANKAMKKWVFTPYFLDGEPMPFLTNQTIRFDGKRASAQLQLEEDPLATLNPKK